MTTLHDNGYSAACAALDYRTRRAAAPAGDPGPDVIADGGRVRVPLALMDGVQREIADHGPDAAYRALCDDLQAGRGQGGAA